VNSTGLKPNYYTIIGVVADTQQNRADLQTTPFRAYYLYRQEPYAPLLTNNVTLVLRTAGNPFSLAVPLRPAVAAIDPNLPVSNIDSFDHTVEGAFASRRLQTVVVGLFSAMTNDK
jgi:putative ABC transport system permease protein